MLQTEHYCTDHHQHYVSENRCPKCLANNGEHKAELRASSELDGAPGSVPSWTPALKNVLMRARVIAKNHGDEYVRLYHLGLALKEASESAQAPNAKDQV